MWSFKKVNKEAEKRRNQQELEKKITESHIKTIINSAENQGIRLNDLYFKRYSDTRDVIKKLANLEEQKIAYTLEFFIQKKQIDILTYKSITTETRPSDYLDIPVGQVENLDYTVDHNLFMIKLKNTRNQYKEKVVHLKKNMEEMHNKYFRTDTCSKCSGSGQVRDGIPPERVRCHPVSGEYHPDERWTSDEEDWENCSKCSGHGSITHMNDGYTIEGYRNEVSQFKNNLKIEWGLNADDLYLLACIGNDKKEEELEKLVKRELSNQKIYNSVKRYPVYIKIITKS